MFLKLLILHIYNVEVYLLIKNLPYIALGYLIFSVVKKWHGMGDLNIFPVCELRATVMPLCTFWTNIIMLWPDVIAHCVILSDPS